MFRSIQTLLLGLAALLPSTIQAQTVPFSLNSVFVYSVKVVCTTAAIPIGIAAQGQAGIREETSRTRINIQNPLDQTARFNYRAVQPRSGASAGATFTPVNETLDSMAARSLDCGDFITLQQNQPAAGVLPGTEGFLTIESRTRLQVAAVYTQRVVKEALKDATTGAGSSPILRGSEASAGATGTSPSAAGITQVAATGDDGVGVGVGRGIGLGIGAGGGIDVEYVEPIVVPRRLILNPVKQPPGGK